VCGSQKPARLEARASLDETRMKQMQAEVQQLRNEVKSLKDSKREAGISEVARAMLNLPAMRDMIAEVTASVQAHARDVRPSLSSSSCCLCPRPYAVASVGTRA
jgi:hypothetical protein